MLKPVKTELQYDDALVRVYQLMQTDVTESSPDSDELEVIMLIKLYELDHHPVPSPKLFNAVGADC